MLNKDVMYMKSKLARPGFTCVEERVYMCRR